MSFPGSCPTEKRPERSFSQPEPEHFGPTSVETLIRGASEVKMEVVFRFNFRRRTPLEASISGSEACGQRRKRVGRCRDFLSAAPNLDES